MALGSDLLLKLIISAQDKTQGAVGSAREGIRSISATAESVYASLKTFLSFQIAIEGAAKLKEGLLAILSTGGQFEKYNASLSSLMGGVAQGQAAFAWIQNFAKTTPFELDGVTKAFVKLKAFGLDPMDGSLRAIGDQTAKLGGGQEELAGIVLALGQAWAKQKLQAEEANQMIERGVPVWELLSKATGKNTAELMKLSEAGAIGRKEIRQLIDTMGRDSAGAMVAQMKTWNGLVSNLKDTWTQFLNTIAASGALDYFKAKVAEANAAFSSMAASGELQARAGQIASAFVDMGKAVAGAASLIGANFATLTHAAEALAGVYAGKLVNAAALWVSGMRQATAAAAAQTAALLETTQAQLGNLQSMEREAVLRASLTKKILDQAKSEAGLAGTMQATQKARLEAAQSAFAETEAIREQVAASKAAVAAARERLAAAQTIQGIVNAENALAQAVKTESELQWTAVAADKARANNLAQLQVRQAAVTAANQEAEAAQMALTAAEQEYQAASARLSAAQKELAAATEATTAKATLAQRAMSGIAAMGNAFVPLVGAIMSLKFAWDEVSDAIDDYHKRQRLYAESLNGAVDAHQRLKHAAIEAMEANRAFSDAAILRGAAFKQQTREQGTAYLDGLEKAKRYWGGVEILEKGAGNATAMKHAALKVEIYTQAIEEAKAKLDGLKASLEKVPTGKFDNSRIDEFARQVQAASANTQEADKAYQDYLKTLTSADLAQLIEGGRQKLAAVRIATGEASEESRRWASVLDQMVVESLNRTGIDGVKAMTGISAEIYKGIAGFSQLEQAIKAAGLSGQQAGAAISAKFTDLVHAAKTRADLDALKAKMTEMTDAGKVGVADLLPVLKAWQDALDKIKGKADAAAGSTQALSQALTGVAAAQAEAQSAAESFASSLDGGSESMDRNQAAIQEFTSAYAAARDNLLYFSDTAAASFDKVMKQWDLFTGANTGEAWFGPLRWADDYLKKLQAQKQAVDELTEGLQAATKSGDGLQNAILAASSASADLSEQQLAGFNAALDAARKKLQDIESSEKSIMQGLEDRLLALDNNQAEIERRKYQREKEKLLADAAQAEASGSAAAIADSKKALALLDEIYRRETANREAEAAAKAKQAPPAKAQAAAVPSQTASETVTINLVKDMAQLPVTVNKSAKKQALEFFQSLGIDQRSST